MRLLSLFYIFFTCSIFAESPHWSLDKITEGWASDTLVKVYFHNSELQRQWAWELLGKYPLKGNERILDFGCGDGKISAEISRFVPQGQVLGYDISSQMIHFAKIKFPHYAYPSLEFRVGDSLVFDHLDQQTYDIITSFCVFHLLADPLDTLKSLKNHLKPTGKLLFVIPAGKNPNLFKAAEEIFIKYQLEIPWKTKSTIAKRTMRTLDSCTSLLEEAGYSVQHLQMVDTDNPFYDRNELMNWMIGTMTANWNIPQSTSLNFMSDLIDKMIELEPEMVDNEGRIHFKLSRIHVVASPIGQ